MTNISDKIKEEIKKKDIKPKPKWNFTFFQILKLIIIAFGVIFLGIAMAINWEIISQNDLPTLFKRPQRFFVMARAIPYFWIGISVILAALVYLEFQKTKKGYKVKFIYIISSIIIFSLFLSGIFYYSGLAELAEEKLEKKRPYQKIVPIPKKHWINPENGMLSGKILQVNNDELFILEDWEENTWEVYIVEETEVGPFTIIAKDNLVKMIGEVEDDNEFEAIFIKTWKEPHHNKGRGKQGKRSFMK